MRVRVGLLLCIGVYEVIFSCHIFTDVDFV